MVLRVQWSVFLMKLKSFWNRLLMNQRVLSNHCSIESDLPDKSIALPPTRGAIWEGHYS
jgi:hypothetical protein